MNPRLLAVARRQFRKQSQQKYAEEKSIAADAQVSDKGAQEVMAILSEYHGLSDANDPKRWYYRGEDSEGDDLTLWEYIADDDSNVQASRGKPKADDSGKPKADDSGRPKADDSGRPKAGIAVKRKQDGRAGRDGDGDGRIFDGTPDETRINPLGDKSASVSSGQVMSTMLRGIAHS